MTVTHFFGVCFKYKLPKYAHPIGNPLSDGLGGIYISLNNFEYKISFTAEQFRATPPAKQILSLNLDNFFAYLNILSKLWLVTAWALAAKFLCS